MIRRTRLLLCAACLLVTAACANQNNPAGSTGDPNAAAPAPGASSDTGSRYLAPDAPIGAIPVETAPVDGTWTGGPTSIARPVPGTTQGPGMPGMGPAAGSPDGAPSGGLPAPPRRQTPPPPPPPLR